MRARSPSLHPSRLVVVAATAALIAVLVPAGAAEAHDPGIWFPQQDPVEFVDSWGDPRGGRSHTGVDLMGAQMQQVYAASDGVIFKAENEHVHQGSYASSYYLLLSGDDGHSYFYVHLNNDTPGRPNGCDGVGGVEHAYSPRLVDELARRGTLEGVRVRKGEHIAYVGSSGNAGCGNDHTHFEIWEGHGWGATKVNPYPMVRNAYDAGRRWGPDGAPPEPGPHDRIAGSNRVLTAVALSEQRFAASDTVVIAPANFHAEALVAAPLAATHAAPVLSAWANQIPERDALPQEVADEIRRLGATSAILVGNADRLSPAVEEQLVAKAGLDPEAIRRIGGANEFEVSRNVAVEVLGSSDGTVSPLLALGDHTDPTKEWPDALAASVVGARELVPVLLTRHDDLPAATREVLEGGGIGEVRIVGGNAAIEPPVEQQVRDLGLATRRLAGGTRFETSIRLADELIDRGHATPSEVFVATGHDFPDAVAAGPAVAGGGSVLVLTHGQDADQALEVWSWLRDRAGTIDLVHGIGGPGAVNDAVLRKAASYAQWSR